MKRSDLILPCILFLIAFGLRFYDISYPAFKWMDEKNNVAAAYNYWTSGQFDPDIWEHPPLRHIILYGFLRIFGDNPYGWRMRTVLGGAIAVVLTGFFAFQVTGNRRTALMAGLLLATDPLHIVVSRFTFEEAYGGALFLAAIICYMRHKQRSAWLLLSAVLMGCALATKWYYVPAWLLLCIMTLREDGNYRDPRTIMFIVSTYILVPVGIYMLSYYPWFGRGYTLSEFIDFTVNAYRSMQSIETQLYEPGLFFLSHTSAGEWFLRPVIVGKGTFLGSDRGEFILFMNNIPVWILTIPAMVMLCIAAYRKRSLLLAAPAIFFTATYMLFLFVDRPVFIYSSVPLLPFAFTAIAFGLTELAGKIRGGNLFYAVFTVLLAWNLYLYPLVTAKMVPMTPYRYLLSIGDVNIH